VKEDDPQTFTDSIQRLTDRRDGSAGLAGFGFEIHRQRLSDGLDTVAVRAHGNSKLKQKSRDKGLGF
jgi:hypothetical protein